MNKKLLPVGLFLALGIGLLSNVVASVSNLVVKEPSLAAVAFMPEEEADVNVPVQIVFAEDIEEPVAELPEVILAMEPEAEPEPERPVVTVSRTEVEEVTVQEVEEVEEGPVAPEPDMIRIAGREIQIVDVDNTGVDAGDHVNRYKDKFLYGHNSAGVFGNLKNVREGQVFSARLDGVERSYRVAKVVIFEKNMETGRLELDGESRYNGKDYMNALAKGKFRGTQYSLSIMTCYGTPYPGRDASHRYVIFALAS